jgi:hypothetical protein
MASLTNMETKLAEVIGLAMAAQDATEKVAKLVKDRQLTSQLKTQKQEAAAAEKDGMALASSIRGKKGAIGKEARSVKKKAAKMMSDYLERNSDGLDGFEFLTMAEAGEVGHWGVLGEMAKSAGNRDMRQLVSKHLPIQRRHLKEATAGSLKLASEEDPNEGGEESPSRRRSSSARRRSTTSRSRARSRAGSSTSRTTSSAKSRSSASRSRSSSSRGSSSRGRSGTTRRRSSS